MFFKRPKTISVYRAGLEEPRGTQARAAAVEDSSPTAAFSGSFRPAERGLGTLSGCLSQAVALVHNHTACFWAKRMRKFLHLPLSLLNKGSCTRASLGWFCFRTSKVSFRNYLAGIPRKIASPYENLLLTVKIHLQYLGLSWVTQICMCSLKCFDP